MTMVCIFTIPVFASFPNTFERFTFKGRILENPNTAAVLENASLTITSPNASSVWNPGTSPKITWTSTGEISDVKLELYQDDNQTLKKPIVSSTPNGGEYIWDVDNVCDLAGLINSNRSQIKISSTSNSSIFDFSEYFEIKVVSKNEKTIPGYSIGLIVLTSIAVIAMSVVKKSKK